MFTLEIWNAMLAWTATVFVLLSGCGSYPAWFGRIYKRARRRRFLAYAPSAWVFGVAWFFVAVMLIVGGVLYAVNYEACQNTYYIVTAALSLTHLVLLAAWTKVFWRYNNPMGAFAVLFFAFCAGIATVVMMGLTAAHSCVNGKTEAWVAFTLWLLPHVWYIVAMVLNWQWTRIPAAALREMAIIDPRGRPLVDR